MTPRVQSWIRAGLAGFFVVAGANHFRVPAFYRPFMPPALPYPDALIFISGVAEILGGLGVLVPRSRAAAGWGLAFLLLAVFPANLHAAFNGLEVNGWRVPAWLLWARLPLQIVFLAWVYVACGQRLLANSFPHPNRPRD